MATIESYRTGDASNKITTYVLKNTSGFFAFDFGSNDIPINDVKKLDYIFITHEHSDHFMGLYNLEYVDVLLKSNCKIFTSNVTKDLIKEIFEYSLKVSFEEREIKKIRELLNRIEGVLFFEKIPLRKDTYFKIFPSGHTYGSAMFYLNDKEGRILYTGDCDWSYDDSDRCYQIDLEENEEVDYIILDGTYLYSEEFRDDELSHVKEKILERGYNCFYSKPEKTVFFAKKIISLRKLKDNYCVVFSSELKWYLDVLKKYNYDPFITDKILLDSSVYALPENRIPLFVHNKKREKQTNVTGLVGLHINFPEVEGLLQQFDPDKTKVLVGHYNSERKNDILDTFHSSYLVSGYEVYILEEGPYYLC